MRSAAELLGRGGSKTEREHAIDTFKYLMRIGKINPTVIPILEEVNIIEMTGWLPEELDRQDAHKIELYKIVWGAKGSEPRSLKREMNRLG